MLQVAVVALSYSSSSTFLFRKENSSQLKCRRRRHQQPQWSICRSNRCDVRVNAEHLTLARQLFDEMPSRDTFAWNRLIETQLSGGQLDRVVCIYQQMLLRGVCPDGHTLPRVLAASRLMDSLSLGRQFHGHAVKLGLSLEGYVVTALIEMYGYLEGVSAAKWVLDKSGSRMSSVAWTLLMDRYVKEKKPRLAIDVFYQMVQSGVEVDPVAVMTAVAACGMLRSLLDGRKVHEMAREFGVDSDVLVGNSLLKMYIDCGRLEVARETFDAIPSRDVVSWTEMIRGYVRTGKFNDGIKLFRKMVLSGDRFKPDPVSICCILPACARMTARNQGKEIHGYLIRNQVDMNITVMNAVMDMYVKSGSIEDASRIFDGIMGLRRDAISWTIMIQGYSLHGQGELGVELFLQMQKQNTTHEIDQLLYAAALHACTTANMVKEGSMYFSSIRAPQVRHYALMVALLARAGLFREARAFVGEKKIEHHADVLRALLVGCRAHGDFKLGKLAAEQLCNFEPLNADNYILLSNWYANRARWDEVDRLRETIEDMGLKPNKAYSWIEFRNKVHVFGIGDVSHPRSEMIHRELHHLMEILVWEHGYRLGRDFSFHDVHEERECNPVGHSEMLAISFGLISTRTGKIRVTKNHHVCHNCHHMAKSISKVVAREIILKDPNCFHHFKDGYCSCGDVW
ncbi:hypothetical protein Dimus_007439 [Dionaea muscipula]